MPSVAANPIPSNNEDLQMKTSKDEEKQASKKKRSQLKVKTEQLFGEDGFKKLKSNFVGMKPLGVGHEAEDLKRIMSLYNDWAYKLCPVPFEDFINQTEKLCATVQAKEFLRRLENGDSNVMNPAEDEDEDFIVVEAPKSNEVESEPPTPVPSVQTPPTPAPMQLSEEQLARIERNKQMALERKRQREQEQQRQQAAADSMRVDDDFAILDE